MEDVNKKFDALKDAESRGWVEEHKPAPRQKKVVKVKILQTLKHDDLVATLHFYLWSFLHYKIDALKRVMI